MAHVSFIPTFHHTRWVDKLDRVVADGPNGFNNRFNAIGADLGQLSTVVTQIGTAIDEFRAPPQPQQQLLSFTPVFRSFFGGGGWTTRPDGTATAQTDNAGGVFTGIMNLTLPGRVRLTTMRVLGDLIPDDTQQAFGEVALSRTALRPTVGQQAVDRIVTASTGHGFGSFDLLVTATGPLARIDPTAFRYFLTGSFETPDDVFPTTSMSVETVQLTFVPA